MTPLNMSLYHARPPSSLFSIRRPTPPDKAPIVPLLSRMPHRILSAHTQPVHLTPNRMLPLMNFQLPVVCKPRSARGTLFAIQIRIDSERVCAGWADGVRPGRDDMCVLERGEGVGERGYERSSGGGYFDVVWVVQGESAAAVVVLAPSGYGAYSADAGAEVRVARISRVAAVVVVILCMRAAESGSMQGAIVARAVDACIANGAARHVGGYRAVDVIRAVWPLLYLTMRTFGGLMDMQPVAARHAWTAYAGYQAGLCSFTGSHREANHSRAIARIGEWKLITLASSCHATNF